MSKKSFGVKLPLGFTNVEQLAALLNYTSIKLNKALGHKDITPEHKFTGFEIIDNQDFSYTIMFYFDNELSIEEIFNRAIIGGM